MRKRRWFFIPIAILLVAGGIWFWSSVGVHWVEPNPARYDAHATSTDMRTDLSLMWETQRLPGTHDASHGSHPRSSTDRAINAASRVFNTVTLVGEPREEVLVRIGEPKSQSDSIYNFPFYPQPAGTLVYRFDTGSYGWQFNVVFGEDGKVREVERLWID
ncbi:MAG TPA: hypothetical protein VHB77_07915 [Planctomycetaceae bacterium]|nr:hypothetical protein [Planctomycetaceae bacterium]